MTESPTSMTGGPIDTRVIVQFEKKFDKWNAGETAGFSEERGLELIQAGVARMVKKIDGKGKPGMVDKQTTVGPQSRPPVTK